MTGGARGVPTSRALDRGRASFDRRRWQDAYAELSHADDEAGLGTADLERLAAVAYLTGRDGECDALRERGHRECLGRGEDVAAARCAFWLGFGLLLRGEEIRGRRVAGSRAPAAGRGPARLPRTGLPAGADRHRQLGAGDPAAALATYEQVGEIGERFADPDLMAFGRLGRGEALVAAGRSTEAAALFDEVMVAATAGELSPTVAGIAYCAVIQACQEISDLRRARTWTSALTRWCAAQPDLVPFRGQCLVHRAEILLLQGAWPEAAEAAGEACERLAAPSDRPETEASGHPAAGGAFYQVAELHRLHGRVAEAERGLSRVLPLGPPAPARAGAAATRPGPGRRGGRGAATCARGGVRTRPARAAGRARRGPPDGRRHAGGPRRGGRAGRARRTVGRRAAAGDGGPGGGRRPARGGPAGGRTGPAACGLAGVAAARRPPPGGPGPGAPRDDLPGPR